MNKILTLLIFAWFGLCQLADGALSDYQDLVIDDISKPEMLARLQSGADLNNVAVIELLLQKAGYLYTDLINKNFAAKQQVVIDYLKSASEPLVTGMATESSVILPDLTGETLAVAAPEVILPDLAAGTLAEPVALPLVAADLINLVKTKIGFGELEIKQRLLNNVVVLEYLLFLLGQDYQESIKSDLAAKQAVLGKIEASALLKTLHDHGYTQDQLVLIVNNSSDEVPAKHNLMVPGKQELDIAERYLPKNINLPAQRPFDGVLSQEEYDYFMQIIKSIDLDLYNQLIKCANILGKPCLRQINDGIESKETHEEGQTIIWFPRSYLVVYHKYSNYKDIKKYVYGELEKLGQLNRQEPVQIILNLIEEFAPIIYKKILEIDPSGQRYVIFDQNSSNAAITCGKDGLPKVFFGHYFINMPFNQKRFIIGHELGHYVLGHCNGTVSSVINKEGESLKKVYNRLEELAADRFAVVSLGISPDDGIAWMVDRYISSGYEHASIGSTHPSFKSRIDQMDQIKAELAIRKVKTQLVDWDKAFDECKLSYGNGYIIS